MSMHPAAVTCAPAARARATRTSLTFSGLESEQSASLRLREAPNRLCRPVGFVCACTRFSTRVCDQDELNLDARAHKQWRPTAVVFVRSHGSRHRLAFSDHNDNNNNKCNNTNQRHKQRRDWQHRSTSAKERKSAFAKQPNWKLSAS